MVVRIQHHLLQGLLALFFATLPAAAHHSAAAFDLQTVISIDAVVSKYEWTNPHIYIHVDARNASGQPVAWVVEAGSPAVMRARGWTKDSFAVGDHVLMEVNPARDRTRNAALIRSARNRGVALAGLAGPVPSGSLPQVGAKASDLTGTWVPTIQPSLHQQLRMAPATLPLTPKGTESLKGFREQSAANPAARCIAPVAPVLMIIPEVKAIEMGGGEVRILSEGFAAERVVDMRATSHDRAAATLQGHSIGTWQDGVLIVDTARFTDNRVGNAIGVASSSRKHLVERFELSADRATLKYSFVLEDPEYLREPVRGELLWTYRPDLKYSKAGCDQENARRFLGE